MFALLYRTSLPAPSLHLASLRQRVTALLFLMAALATTPAALAQQCTGLCLHQGCTPSGSTIPTSNTTVTGTLYTPNGTDPLPNAVVFVPNVPNTTTSSTSLTPFAAGVQCVTSGSPVSDSPLVGAYTDSYGHFTLTNVPVGVDFAIVAQAGRWRSKVIVPAVTCGSTTVKNISFPSTQTSTDTDDNIPLIAVATGYVDAAECVLRKVGIADTQFSDPSGTGRIRFYYGSRNGGAGSKIDAATPSENQLEGNNGSTTSDLNNYDMVMFPCQGGSPTVNSTAYANILAYVNKGGRVFATHWSEVWVDASSPFSAMANWVTGTITSSSAAKAATINTTGTFTDGQTIAQWLQNIGATTTYGLISSPPGLVNTFDNVASVNSPTQTWITLNTTGNPIMQFTFNTPTAQYGGTSTNQCGRILFNDYHVETPAIQSGTFPTECNNTAMTPQEKILEYSLFDLSTFIQPAGPPTITMNWSNSPSTFTEGDTADTIILNVTNTSTVNASDPSLTINLGNLPTGLTATSLADTTGSGGWICNVSALSCNRVSGLSANTSASVTLTFSVAATAPVGPATVSATVAGGGLTTNVTTPTDPITILGKPQITWPTPAAITWPTPLSNTQLDATATGAGGTPLAGTFTYTPAATTMLDPGTYTLSVSFLASDTTDYPSAASGMTTLLVNPAMQAITFNPIASPVTYGVGPIPLSASDSTSPNSGNPIIFSVLSGPATVSGNSLIITGAGTVKIAADQAGNTDYAAATEVIQTLTVNPATLTVTADNKSIVYGAALPNYTATITGYVNSDTIAVVSGAPAFTTTPATPSTVGGYPIAPALGTLSAANYTFVFVNGTLAITQAAQTITFTLPSPVTYGVAPITLTATGGGSTSPVVFSLVSGPATLSGSTLTITGAGPVVVNANQAGDTNYTAAAQVQQTLVVNQATLTVTAASPTITYGTAVPAYTAAISGYVNSDTSAVVSGAPSLTTTPATPSNAGTYPITAAIGSLSATNYTFAFVPGTLTINQATQTISFTLPSPVTYGTPPITLTATGGASGNPVTFSIVSGPGSITGSILTITGGGTIVVAANQAGNTNYSAATQVTQTLLVNPEAQTINFTAPASPVTYGNPPITLVATATSGLPVVFSVLSGPGSITGNTLTITGGGATILVAADQAGNANYAAAPEVTYSILVNKAATAISVFTATPGTLFIQNPIVLTTTVTSAAGIPTGTVTFTADTGTLLGSAAVNSAGVATFTTSFATVGTHTVQAVYNGSSGYGVSPQMTANETLMDFNLTAIGVTAQDVVHGTSATYTYSLSPIGGAAMPQAITFALDGYPGASVLTFSPQPLAAGAGISTVTLTVQTPDYPTQSAANQDHTPRTLAFILLGALLLPLGRRKARNKTTRWLACALLLLAGAGAVTGVSGCGSGWQHENFTLTMSASSNNLAHYAVTTLRVH
jgi:hypothetical protein